MKLKEAAERFPAIKNIAPLFPDDTYVYYDGICSYIVTLGLELHIKQEFAREVIENMKNPDDIGFLPRDWYMLLHEALIESEVKYLIKIKER